ncbi:hypothetical protein Leryth_002039 [Lithospermum erythrorhizon]|uniref:Homeodomain transcription factor n=1 Tax=Lithospermum erythrorhizon TaxID=34254 RepID=A0AAV3RW00_LITER|nr:hypothetical protein Leryth_002039 [Lithospermum erythrorhizon]
MVQTMKQLYEAAMEGSVTRLLDLLKQDSLILNRCTITTYSETPLHIAAMLGHLDFCSELLSKNPGLSEALDSRRSSALHLASAKGHLGIVKILVSARPEMCLAYDGDGNNSVHMAAMKGQVDVLEELVKVRPEAARARVKIPENWTTLHLCVQYYQIEALKFLVDALKDQEFINAKDDSGNSILHLAVADKQFEIIEFLVSKGQMDVNALNSKGLTTLDILAQTRRDSKYFEIAYFLQLHGARRSSQKEILSNNQSSLSIIPGGHKSEVIDFETSIRKPSTKNSYGEWLEEQRQSLMVVASLIATMGFQAVITLPGGLWSEDLKKYMGNNGPDNEIILPHSAGQSILALKQPGTYKRIVFFNTLGFVASLGTILLLISGLRFKHKSFVWILMVVMWISIFSTASTYLLAVIASVTDDLMDDFDNLYYILTNGVSAMLCLLITAHTIHSTRQRILKWTIKKKVCLWIVMVIVWVSVAVMWAKLFPYYDPLDILIGACVVFATFFVLLYAMQIKNFIVNKVKSCFQEFKSSWTSCNQDRTQV